MWFLQYDVIDCLVLIRCYIFGCFNTHTCTSNGWCGTGLGYTLSISSNLRFLAFQSLCPAVESFVFRLQKRLDIHKVHSTLSCQIGNRFCQLLTTLKFTRICHLSTKMALFQAPIRVCCSCNGHWRFPMIAQPFCLILVGGK